MGLDISIRIIEPVVCQNCGKIAGYRNAEYEEISAGGRLYYPMLAEIGYSDEDYGKFKLMTKEQAKIVINSMKECGKCFMYGCGGEETVINTLNGAIEAGLCIELEADW